MATKKWNMDDLLRIVTHPAFIALLPYGLGKYVLRMEDPKGDAWQHIGPLDECIAMAFAELPLEG